MHNVQLRQLATASRLVQHAGRTMADIVASVGRVTDIMSEITSAGAEQEVGIQEITQAISQMDTVTQQNAALVGEAAAAEAMQDHAAALARMVAVFKLDATRAKPTPSAACLRRETAAKAMIAYLPG